MEELYRLRWGRLDDIALHVFHGRRGGFLKVFADAWLTADAANKAILEPAWDSLIDKYNLEKEPEEA